MKISLYDGLYSGNSSRNDKVISIAAKISGFTEAQCRTLMNLNKKEVVLERTQNSFLKRTAWFLLENNVVTKELEGKVEQEVLDKYEHNLYRYAQSLDSEAHREVEAIESEWIASGIYSATYIAKVTEWTTQELLRFISTGEIDFGSFPELEG